MTERPNMIIVLTDDMGYGDIRAYGPTPIRTPHLDSIAAEGALLTNFYATSPVCSPSRAGLLTGRYPVRTRVYDVLHPSSSAVHLAYRLFSKAAQGMPTDEILLPELLQQAGYRTGMVGKWHLGDRSPHLPNDRGFEFFYGALYSNDMKPYRIYRNRQVDLDDPVDQDHLTQHLTRAVVNFIREGGDKPFFLYYAQPFPHEPLHASQAFRGKSGGGLYGDAVEELDWSVGEILRTLQDLEMDDNTLLVFTSDNGPWWQGSPGGLRGRKNLVFEGGFRVPFIARWPGVIPAGLILDAMSMNFDIFATCLAIAGIVPPDDRIIDGRNMLPLLTGEEEQIHETLFFYKRDKAMAVRHGDLKYHRRHISENSAYPLLRQGPFLFNLPGDRDESYSLIESEPQAARALAGLLDEHERQVKANPRGWLSANPHKRT
ncbi:MAG: sulfatase [Chloroflexota bacterium]|nr:sulfatase [Chloroflexota bacterium]